MKNIFLNKYCWGNDLFNENKLVFLYNGELESSFDKLMPVKDFTKQKLVNLKEQIEGFDEDVKRVEDLDFKIDRANVKEKTLLKLVLNRFQNYSSAIFLINRSKLNEKQKKVYDETLAILESLKGDIAAYKSGNIEIEFKDERSYLKKMLFSKRYGFSKDELDSFDFENDMNIGSYYLKIFLLYPADEWGYLKNTLFEFSVNRNFNMKNFESVKLLYTYLSNPVFNSPSVDFGNGLRGLTNKGDFDTNVNNAIKIIEFTGSSRPIYDKIMYRFGEMNVNIDELIMEYSPLPKNIRLSLVLNMNDFRDQYDFSSIDGLRSFKKANNGFNLSGGISYSLGYLPDFNIDIGNPDIFNKYGLLLSKYENEIEFLVFYDKDKGIHLSEIDLTVDGFDNLERLLGLTRQLHEKLKKNTKHFLFLLGSTGLKPVSLDELENVIGQIPNVNIKTVTLTSSEIKQIGYSFDSIEDIVKMMEIAGEIEHGTKNKEALKEDEYFESLQFLQGHSYISNYEKLAIASTELFSLVLDSYNYLRLIKNIPKDLRFNNVQEFKDYFDFEKRKSYKKLYDSQIQGKPFDRQLEIKDSMGKMQEHNILFSLHEDNVLALSIIEDNNAFSEVVDLSNYYDSDNTPIFSSIEEMKEYFVIDKKRRILNLSNGVKGLGEDYYKYSFELKKLATALYKRGIDFEADQVSMQKVHKLAKHVDGLGGYIDFKNFDIIPLLKNDLDGFIDLYGYVIPELNKKTSRLYSNYGDCLVQLNQMITVDGKEQYAEYLIELDNFINSFGYSASMVDSHVLGLYRQNGMKISSVDFFRKLTKLSSLIKAQNKWSDIGKGLIDLKKGGIDINKEADLDMLISMAEFAKAQYDIDFNSYTYYSVIMLYKNKSSFQTFQVLEQEFGIKLEPEYSRLTMDISNIKAVAELHNSGAISTLLDFKNHFGYKLTNGFRMRDEVGAIINVHQSGAMETVLKLKNHFGFTLKKRYNGEVSILESVRDDYITRFHLSGAMETLLKMKEASVGIYGNNIDACIGIHNLPDKERNKIIESVNRLATKAGWENVSLSSANKVMKLEELGAIETVERLYSQLGKRFDIRYPGHKNIIKFHSLAQEEKDEIISIAKQMKEKVEYEFMYEDTDKLLKFKEDGMIDFSISMCKLFDLSFNGVLNSRNYDSLLNLKQIGALDTIKKLKNGFDFEIDSYDLNRPSFYELIIKIHNSDTTELIGKIGKLDLGVSLPKFVDFNKLHDPRYLELLNFVVDNFNSKKGSIEKSVETLNHLFQLDYPVSKAKQSLKAFDAFSDANQENFFPGLLGSKRINPELGINLFFKFFAVDYNKTNMQIFGIDPEKEIPRDLPVVSDIAEGLGGLESGIDLQNFDPNNVESYENLFTFIRKNGLTHWEQKVLEGINYKPFKKYVDDNSLSNVVSKIREFKNRVHPNIDKILINFIDISVNTLSGELKQYLNPKTGMINVTQNNIGDVNSILELCLLMKDRNGGLMAEIVKSIFPDHVGDESFENNFAFMVSMLDVEEINFKQVDNIEQLKDLLGLQKKAKKFSIKANERYINNKFSGLDLIAIFTKGKIGEDGADTTFCCDTRTIEEMRKYMNDNVDRVTGDRFVTSLGANFLKDNPVNYDNLDLLFRFAKNWKSVDTHRDVKGLYNLISNFAYNKIVRFINSELGENQENKSKVDGELKKQGSSLEFVINELNSNGVPFEIVHSKVQKGLIGLAAGRRKYVTRRATEDKSEKINVKGISISLEQSNWKTHKGVKVLEVKIGGKEVAKAIKIKREFGSVKMLMSETGMVDMDQEERGNKGRLIFSAPLAFTTGNHKMTEIAIQEGKTMNYLLSTKGKDGFVISDPDGRVRILNKTKLKLSNFLDNSKENLGRKDRRKYEGFYNQDGELEDRGLDVMNNLEDFILFINFMETQKLSLLANMLLVENGQLANYGTDGADSRRFFVEYNDGSIGVIDSTENMSTKSLMEIAVKSGVKNAVYMDTGMYDMAAFHQPDGKKRIMGHNDTNMSSNRLVVYSGNSEDKVSK